jgi:hypothetical protein
MIKKIKNWLKKIFRNRKKLKPNKNPKVTEIVAGGFIKAPEQYCVKVNELNNKNKK